MSGEKLNRSEKTIAAEDSMSKDKLVGQHVGKKRSQKSLR